MGLVRAALAISGLLLAFGAAAETYHWTDGNGQEHFTSNLQDVPAQYREAAGYEPEKALIREAQPPASAGSLPRSAGSSNPFRAVKSRIDRMGDSRRVEVDPAPPKEERPLTGDEKYEVKCNRALDRCRKIQTPEFRQWKASEKAREAQNESED